MKSSPTGRTWTPGLSGGRGGGWGGEGDLSSGKAATSVEEYMGAGGQSQLLVTMENRCAVKLGLCRLVRRNAIESQRLLVRAKGLHGDPSLVQLLLTQVIPMVAARVCSCVDASHASQAA